MRAKGKKGTGASHCEELALAKGTEQPNKEYEGTEDREGSAHGK